MMQPNEQETPRMSKYLLICLIFPVSIPATSHEKLNEVLNYHQINERIGTGGQPTPDQFKTIRKAGYQTIINLAMPDSPNALSNEGATITQLGMTYIHIPVPWKSPSVSDLKQFLGFMKALESQKVFVHCAANYRASAFTNRYLRLMTDATKEESMTPILKKWLPEMDNGWKAILNFQG